MFRFRFVGFLLLALSVFYGVDRVDIGRLLRLLFLLLLLEFLIES